MILLTQKKNLEIALIRQQLRSNKRKSLRKNLRKSLLVRSNLRQKVRKNRKRRILQRIMIKIRMLLFLFSSQTIQFVWFARLLLLLLLSKFSCLLSSSVHQASWPLTLISISRHQKLFLVSQQFPTISSTDFSF